MSLEQVRTQLDTTAKEMGAYDAWQQASVPVEVNDYDSRQSSDADLRGRLDKAGIVVVGSRVISSQLEGNSQGGVNYMEYDGSPEDAARYFRMKGDAMSVLMDIKLALMGASAGGAKGSFGVPKGTFEEHDWAISESFVDYALTQRDSIIRPEGLDGHGPDMNTGTAHMDLAARALGAENDPRAQAAFTNKSPEEGGLGELRTMATGVGGIDGLERHFEVQGESLEGKQLAIQGMGPAGLWLAKEASRRGAQVTAVAAGNGALFSDRSDPIFDKDGNPNITISKGLISDEAGRYIHKPREAILGADAHVLWLAARPNAIDKDNIRDTRARTLAFLANGGISGAAIETAIENKQTIITADVLSGAGVILSIRERDSNLSGNYPDEAEARQLTNESVVRAYDKSYAAAGENPLHLAHGANKAGILSVIERRLAR